MGGDLSQAYGLLALGILTFLPGMSKDISISFVTSTHLLWQLKVILLTDYFRVQD